MGNRQIGGIAIKAGATLTGLGTLATLAIFVARATDNSSITNYDRGYGPFTAALNPAPTTTPDDMFRPSAAPAAPPTPGTLALGTAMSSAVPPTATAGVMHGRAAVAVLTPSAHPPAAASPAPPPATNGPAPQATVTPLAPTQPWTLSPMPSPTPTSVLPPWRLHGPSHAHPAIHGHGDPPPGAHGHDPLGHAGRMPTTDPATDPAIDPAVDPAMVQGPAPAPQPLTFQSTDGSPNAPSGHDHKAKDPKTVAGEQQ